MLRKNEGFFLAEMLISMAAFIMAISILLPYALYVSRQTVQARQESDAVTILFDELMHIKITGTESERNLIMKNGFQYQVVVSKDASSPDWEVCVRYGKNGVEERECAFTQ